MEQSDNNLWENQANLNDIDSKCSLSRFFQDLNLHPQIKGYVHAFSLSFFPFEEFFKSLI